MRLQDLFDMNKSLRKKRKLLLRRKQMAHEHFAHTQKKDTRSNKTGK